jgi:hypothetical protein
LVSSPDTLLVSACGNEVTLDIFDSSPSHRLAAVDIDSHINVNAARRRISPVNSRWVAPGLDLHLQKMMLFDFKQMSEQAK